MQRRSSLKCSFPMLCHVQESSNLSMRTLNHPFSPCRLGKCYTSVTQVAWSSILTSTRLQRHSSWIIGARTSANLCPAATPTLITPSPWPKWTHQTPANSCNSSTSQTVTCIRLKTKQLHRHTIITKLRHLKRTVTCITRTVNSSRRAL